MRHQSVTQAAARGHDVGRAAMIKHYAAQIRRRKDLTSAQKRDAISKYGSSLGSQ